MKAYKLVILLIVWTVLTNAQELPKDTLQLRMSQNKESPEYYMNLPVILPQSGQAAELVRSILFPVSYHTGLPKIEIPLYDIKFKDGTTLPIKLIYDASFKMGEEKHRKLKQRVGIGWILQAEPHISRIVNGRPDEHFYFKESNLDQFFDVTNPSKWKKAIESMYSGEGDFLPDQYFYRLLNTSGSFFSNRCGVNHADKEYVTVPFDPIKINSVYEILDANGYKYTFKNGDITAYKVLHYNHANEIDIQYPSIYKADTIISPVNEQIIFKYDSIEQEGTAKMYSNLKYNKIIRSHPVSTYTVSVEGENCPFIPSTPGLCFDLGICNMSMLETVWNNLPNEAPHRYEARVKVIECVPGPNPYEYKRTAYLFSNNILYRIPEVNNSGIVNQSPLTLESFTALQEIDFPGGKIKFVDKYLNEYYKILDYIEVIDKQQNLIKKIKFITHLCHGERFRAFLDKIQFVDYSSNKEYEYQFEYQEPTTASPSYSDYFFDEILPVGITKRHLPVLINTYDGTDTLKFHLTGDDLSDYYPNVLVTVYDDEDPKDIFNNYDDKNQIEHYLGKERSDLMLKKIVYPAKGSAVFTYEPHCFLSHTNRFWYDTINYYDNYNFNYPPGIRIKKIEYFDKNNQLANYRTYKYGKEENGCGIPFRKELKPEDFVISQYKKYDNIFWCDKDRGGMFNS
jgi:hypothetical protein